LIIPWLIPLSKLIIVIIRILELKTTIKSRVLAVMSIWINKTSPSHGELTNKSISLKILDMMMSILEKLNSKNLISDKSFKLVV